MVSPFSAHFPLQCLLRSLNPYTDSVCVLTHASLTLAFFLCLSVSVSLDVCWPHPLPLNPFLSLYPLAFLVCVCVESRATVSVCVTRGQGAVPVSVVCWYRMQSLSFTDCCISLEVTHPDSDCLFHLEPSDARTA